MKAADKNALAQEIVDMARDKGMNAQDCLDLYAMLALNAIGSTAILETDTAERAKTLSIGVYMLDERVTDWAVRMGDKLECGFRHARFIECVDEE